MTPLGWENPLRLAEDLATVDVLSGGRINPGVSVGTPMQYDTVKDALYPHTAEAEDFSKARVERLARHLAGERVRELEGKQGVVEEFSARVEPHSPACGTGSGTGRLLDSAVWAGQNGLHLLLERDLPRPARSRTSPRSRPPRSVPSAPQAVPAPPRAWS